jgi:Putative restriction endonuclease
MSKVQGFFAPFGSNATPLAQHPGPQRNRPGPHPSGADSFSGWSGRSQRSHARRHTTSLQGDAFFLDSPRIVVEVLSKSTEARDRTYKLLHYQAKQSIQEIVLISQYVQHVEVIPRTPSGWEYQEYGHEERFTLASLNATIRVAEIYRRLSIPIEKRTLMPLESIEPADEQGDS